MQNTQVVKQAEGLSARFLVVAAVFLIFFFVFIMIANEMVLENQNQLDATVFDEVDRIADPALTRLMEFITIFGSRYFLLPAYVVLIAYFLVFKRYRKLSLDVAAIGTTSTIVLLALKAIFHRQRPMDPLLPHVNGYSFPSGHSFCSFTFFGLLIYILWKNKINPYVRWVASVFFFLFATVIAFSRLYLHVHYASDVIAGFCLCAAWLGFSIWILNRFNPTSRARDYQS
jgi:undecaprenyl-diphosphatase